MTLTPAERLFLWRRRNNYSWKRAAKAARCTRYAYIMAELDRGTIKFQPPMRRPTDAERCALYRRRAKVTQAKVAKDLQVSRAWVNRMERGRVACDTLLWYWEH